VLGFGVVFFLFFFDVLMCGCLVRCCYGAFLFWDVFYGFVGCCVVSCFFLWVCFFLLVGFCLVWVVWGFVLVVFCGRVFGGWFFVVCFGCIVCGLFVFGVGFGVGEVYCGFWFYVVGLVWGVFWVCWGVGFVFWVFLFWYGWYVLCVVGFLWF